MSRDSDRHSLRLAIVTTATPTETFIRAHLERLPFRILHLAGYGCQYSQDGRAVRSLIGAVQLSLPERLCTLLPEFVSFRIRKRYFGPIDDEQVLSDYLRAEEVDVVLAEYGMIGAFLAPVCMKTKIPLVVHFHGADVTRRDFVESFGSRYRSMFRSASACIVVSKKMRADLVALGCTPEKIVLCPYGPNEEFFNCCPNYYSEQLVAIGRLTPKKAPHLTILAFAEALKSTPSLRLVMIGDGELRGVCEDLVSSLFLTDKVLLTGAMTPNQIREEMSRSFAFLQHSVQAWDGDCEGTPVSVLEASAAGLPIISTRHAGIVDVVKHGETGLLGAERDIKAMTQSILAYANNRAYAEECGKNAREHIRLSFPMDRHLNHLSKVIESVSELRGDSRTGPGATQFQCDSASTPVC